MPGLGQLHQPVSHGLLPVEVDDVVIVQEAHDPASQYVLGVGVAPEVADGDLLPDMVHQFDGQRDEALPLGAIGVRQAGLLQQDAQERGLRLRIEARRIGPAPDRTRCVKSRRACTRTSQFSANSRRISSRRSLSFL